jgi:hypothetical protein
MDAAKRYLNQAVELGDQEAVEVLKQIKEKEDSCFITTAASRILGWADQGPELTRFRAFRDETLRSDDAGEEEVKWYYDFAPHIVASIESSTDAESVWAAVAHEHLEPIDQLLLAGDGQGAHAKYRHMVLRLAGRFLPPTVPLPAGSIRNPL